MARLSPTKAQAQVQLEDGYLLALAEQGSPDAYDRLVRRYDSFVRLKASSYFLIGGDSEDLIQEGLVGLYKAIRDFRSDRESSFRNFAELCITRQIITAVKTATRNKHTPLNGYVSFSATPAGASDSEPTLDEVLPGSPVHDPVNQVISSEELRSLVACLSTVLSELESRVLSLYLDGHSYAAIGEKLDCDCKTVDNALQRVKRKVGAHLRVARRPAVIAVVPTWLIIVLVVLALLAIGGVHRALRCSLKRTRGGRSETQLEQANHDLAEAAAAGPRLGPRDARGAPRAASTPSSAAPSLPSCRSSRCSTARAPTRTRPSSASRARAGTTPLTLGRRDGEWVLDSLR